MDTALLAYSGISIKMLVDLNLGAELLTMFMVDYEPGGGAKSMTTRSEAYFFLEGQIEAEIEGEKTSFRKRGRVVCGVGVLHGFFNTSSERWLDRESSPNHPAGTPTAGRRPGSNSVPSSGGTARRDNRLRVNGATVMIGGTSGIGLELARECTRLGQEVVISAGAPNGLSIARQTSGAGPRIGVDLYETQAIAGALAPIGHVGTSSSWPSSVTATTSPNMTNRQHCGW